MAEVCEAEVLGCLILVSVWTALSASDYVIKELQRRKLVNAYSKDGHGF